MFLEARTKPVGESVDFETVQAATAILQHCFNSGDTAAIESALTENTDLVVEGIPEPVTGSRRVTEHLQTWARVLRKQEHPKPPAVQGVSTHKGTDEHPCVLLYEASQRAFALFVDVDRSGNLDSISVVTSSERLRGVDRAA